MFGRIRAAGKPAPARFIYSYAVYETPSEICKNREQWFELSSDGRGYFSSDPGTFPHNLTFVARKVTLRTIQSGPASDRHLGSCLSEASAL